MIHRSIVGWVERLEAPRYYRGRASTFQHRIFTGNESETQHSQLWHPSGCWDPFAVLQQ